MTNKLVVFIDGANFYETNKALDIDIDYGKLKSYFWEIAEQSNQELLRVYYFTAIKNRNVDQPLVKLIDWLDYNGYTMITKPTKTFIDSNGQEKTKGNMDIELAVEALSLCHKNKSINHVLLLSGDGDFTHLINELQSNGIEVGVISTIKTTPAMCADELRRQVDYFIELKDIENKITRS